MYTVQGSTVQYSTVQYSTVQYSTVQCSTVQYSAVQYSTVQYSTVQYSTVQYSTVSYLPSPVQCRYWVALQYSTGEFSCLTGLNLQLRGSHTHYRGNYNIQTVRYMDIYIRGGIKLFTFLGHVHRLGVDPSSGDILERFYLYEDKKNHTVN